MKTFTYTDNNGHTQYGTVYDYDIIDLSKYGDEIFSRPACVLGYHIKLDMILAAILWVVIIIAFGAEINFFAWMIGGFVYHIVKNIVRLRTKGIRSIIP